MNELSYDPLFPGILVVSGGKPFSGSAGNAFLGSDGGVFK